MCYSASSTSKNIDLSKKYGKKIPANLNETPVFFASGFSFPTWRIVTKAAHLQAMNWGLIPNWFKEPNFKEIASMTLNAKVETLNEKASFKHLIKRNECIIPASGFFEWQTSGKEKIPFFIAPSKGGIFSMAGIYDVWMHPLTGEQHSTFSMLTCPANELMEEIHNSKKRMPVLLKPEQENDWLQGTLDLDILKTPLSSVHLKAHEVNRKLISGKINNLPEVLLPFKNEFYAQGSLF
jgi:putative SOS response-associated peptidase YedK